MLTKLKNFVKNNSSDIFIIITIILVTLTAFGIGRLTVPKTEPIQIKNLEKASIENLLPTEQGINNGNNQGDIQGENQGDYKGQVVGSKNSDKYHLPECPGAKQISEQNKVWFDSIEATEKAGYKPAGNCPGLK